MDFCDRCGSILIPVNDKGKQILRCAKCNRKAKGKKLIVKEEIIRKKVGTGVSDKEEQTMATVNLEQPCEKCGNTKAYQWSMQTRSSDEPETEFFRCTKCKYTWREYS